MTLSAQRVDTMGGIINPRFASLQVSVNDDWMAPPVIVLGSDDRLVVEFDELSEDRSYLRCSLLHCNANWQPSQLVDVEFVEGFNLCDVDLWEYSRATTVHYVHYTIEIPNEHLCPKVSGNYLVRVFAEDDPDDILLQVRFMVSEHVARISGDVLTATDIDYNSRHQQLSVAVDVTDTDVADPYNELIVNISQNGRMDNEVSLRQPLRMQGKTAVYEHLPALIFPAGNEYRRFETVSTNYPSMNVEDVGYYHPYYHATLLPDQPRYDQPYTYDSTQHGRYFVREYNSSNSDTEADYVVTHFTLEMPEIVGATVWLDGDFTSRRFDSRSMMVYNHDMNRYEKALLLKQGAYNYQYLTTRPGDNSAHTAPIEGDFYRTNNEYFVKVYHRPYGSCYDRLIATGRL